jgi:hypothetical protein
MTTPIDLATLLDYATIRLEDGADLAEAVVQDLQDGMSMEELRAAAVQSQAFLTAYFADCVLRIQDARDDAPETV